MNDEFPNSVEVRLVHRVEDKLDDNIDVVVSLADGSRWGATFFTLKNVGTLMEQYKVSGECLWGEYFWARKMILVNELSQEGIERIVAEMIRAGEFDGSFERFAEESD